AVRPRYECMCAENATVEIGDEIGTGDEQIRRFVRKGEQRQRPVERQQGKGQDQPRPRAAGKKQERRGAITNPDALKHAETSPFAWLREQDDIGEQKAEREQSEAARDDRSEERRVGKEGRCGWWAE